MPLLRLILAAFLLVPAFVRAQVPPAEFTTNLVNGATTLNVRFQLFTNRTADFAVFVQTGTNTFTNHVFDVPRTYLGYATNRADVFACATLLPNGQIWATVLFPSGVTWHYQNGANTGPTVRGSASYTANWPTTTRLGSGGAGTNVYAATTGWDLRWTYFNNQAGGNLDTAVRRAEHTTMSANLIYLSNAGLIHRLRTIVIRAQQASDPYENNSELLTTVRAQWRDVLPAAIGRSYPFVWGLASPGYGGGVAYTSAAGTASGCSVNGLNAQDWDVVWRHEVGHNWSLGHYDGGTPEGSTINSGNGLGRMSATEQYKVVSFRNGKLGQLTNLGPFPLPIPPYAALDTATVSQVGATTIDVLNNDHDANGQTITIDSFPAASAFGATITRSVGTGPGGRDRLTYTANVAGGAGLDRFTYTAKDSFGLVATGNVYITVTNATLVTGHLLWDANVSLAGAQDGSGTWTNTGPGWWNGTNHVNFTNGFAVTFGATNGAAGTVTLGGAVATPSLTFARPGSGTYTLAGPGTLVFNGVTNLLAAHTNATIAADIVRNAELLKTGPGIVSLDGQGADVQGDFVLSQGGVRFSQTNVFGGATNLIILGDENTGANTISLTFTDNNTSTRVTGNAIEVSAEGTGEVRIGRQTTVSSGLFEHFYSGPLTLLRDVVLFNHGTQPTGSGQVRFNGPITGTATVFIEGTPGNAGVVFSHANGVNSFTSDLTLRDHGVLQLGTLTTANNIIPDSSRVVFLGSNTVFRLSNNNAAGGGETIGGLISENGRGTVTINSGATVQTLTLNVPPGETVSYSGTLNNGNRTLALTKTGGGKQILTGPATHTGTNTLANNGGFLEITRPDALGGGVIFLAKNGTNSGTLQFNFTGPQTFTNSFAGFLSTSFTLGEDTVPCLQNLAGDTTITSPLIVTTTGGSGLAVASDGGLLTLAGNLGATITGRGIWLGGSGAGRITGSVTNGQDGTASLFLRKYGSGTWTLAGTNSYTGPTTVYSGLLLVTGSTDADSAVTVNAGGALGGTGTVNGSTTLQTGGTLTPGVGGVGRLAFSGTLTLNGTTLMEISRTGSLTTNDQASVAGAVNYGGQLIVTNVGPDSLQAGDSFQLFNAATRNGSFTNLVLPPLPPGLTWTNQLASVGTLAVVTTASTNPIPLTASVGGGNLTLAWPASHVGWRLETQTNPLTSGLGSNWTTVPGSALTNSLTLPIIPGNPAVFFRLSYP